MKLKTDKYIKICPKLSKTRLKMPKLLKITEIFPAYISFDLNYRIFSNDDTVIAKSLLKEWNTALNLLRKSIEIEYCIIDNVAASILLCWYVM